MRCRVSKMQDSWTEISFIFQDAVPVLVKVWRVRRFFSFWPVWCSDLLSFRQRDKRKWTSNRYYLSQLTWFLSHIPSALSKDTERHRATNRGWKKSMSYYAPICKLGETWIELSLSLIAFNLLFLWEPDFHGTEYFCRIHKSVVISYKSVANRVFALFNSAKRTQEFTKMQIMHLHLIDFKIGNQCNSSTMMTFMNKSPRLRG